MSGTNAAIGGGGFHHVAIRAADFDAAMKFYSQTLGMKPTMAWGTVGHRAAMLDTGDGSYMEVFENPGQKPANDDDDAVIVHIALRSSNVDAAIERARAAGCPVTVEPKDMEIPTSPKPTPVRIAFCKGPDGVQVEFFQNR
jgi:glyoxylase I family protein